MRPSQQRGRCRCVRLGRRRPLVKTGLSVLCLSVGRLRKGRNVSIKTEAKVRVEESSVRELNLKKKKRKEKRPPSGACRRKENQSRRQSGRWRRCSTDDRKPSALIGRRPTNDQRFQAFPSGSSKKNKNNSVQPSRKPASQPTRQQRQRGRRTKWPTDAWQAFTNEIRRFYIEDNIDRCAIPTKRYLPDLLESNNNSVKLD